MYQPLTKEQYDAAINSGYDSDTIIQNELRRKAESGPKEQPQRNFLEDAINTVVAKPAIRVGQLFGYGIAKLMGATPEQLQKGLEADYTVPGTKFGAETQKAFGEGGGTQIASDALKEAAYLAPYGKIAKFGSEAAAPLLSEGAARIAGGAVAGATGGYAQDVAQGLDEGEKGRAFIPGFTTLIGGVLGGGAEAAGLGLEKTIKGAREMGKEFEQQTFKLTPTQKTNLGAKLDELTQFSADNIPAGNPEQRFAYADDLYQHYEEQLQGALERTKPVKLVTGETVQKPLAEVPKDTFLKQLISIKGSYKYDRDAEAVYSQIDDAIKTIKNQYKGDFIPVDKLNIFKRTTYQNAYNKAGSKVLDTVEHDIGDAARVAIERATEKAGVDIGGKSIGEFNHEYGNLIQLRKILKLAQNRPELGFTKRIMSRIIGGIIGHSLGGIPGLVGGELIAEPIAKGIAGTAAATGMSKRLMNVKDREIGSVIQRLRP